MKLKGKLARWLVVWMALLAFFLPGKTSFAFEDAAAAQPGFTRSGDTITLTNGATRLQVDVVGPDAIRISSAPISPTLVLAPAPPPAPPGGKGEILSARMGATLASIRTRAMSVEIQRSPLEVRVYDASHKLLARVTDLPGQIAILHSEAQFYGVGASDVWGSVEDGLLRPDGGAVKPPLQGNATGPWIFSARLGVLVDAMSGQFEADPGRLSYKFNQGAIPDFFVMVGGPKALINRMTALTGRPPMLPKWALGFINSQWGITQSQLEAIVKTYRDKHIPLDGFGLDFDYKAWGQDHFGEFRWNEETFPDGASGELAQRLREQGVHLLGIMKPRIITQNADGAMTQAAQELDALGCWYPRHKSYADYFSKLPARDIDFNKPECRAWFWKNAQVFYKSGIAGWWNDEADINAETKDVFDPAQALNMARAMYEGQRSAGDERVFTLNRSFFTGAQRYAYALWSGDIESSEESMARQPARMLSSVSMGAASWSMDAGGFINDPPMSNETYARWMQFAAFVPIMRAHGYQYEVRQPWVFGPDAEHAATDAIKQRYELMPYIYSYERQKNQTGVGLVRPMFYEFPDDPAQANQIGQWMFGEYMLVSPAMTDQQTHVVTLPEGVWMESSTHQKYVGPGQVRVDRFATFIREGAIIPKQAAQNYTGETPLQQLNVDVYPSDKLTRFEYYDDDGHTYAYENGAYFKQVFQTRRDGNTVVFDTGEVEGSYTPALTSYIVQLNEVADGAPMVNGKAIPKADYEFALNPMDAGYVIMPGANGNVMWVKIPAGKPIHLEVKNAKPGQAATPQNAQVNLAFNKPVMASSAQDMRYPPAYAVDGNSNTRWSSAITDVVTFTLDLGQTVNISRVVLNWEAAYAKAYTLSLASNVDGPWSEYYGVQQDFPPNGLVSLIKNGVGRFVRLVAAQRSGDWGYSLYDFEVYGAAAKTPAQKPSTCASNAVMEKWPNTPGNTLEDFESITAKAPSSKTTLKKLELTPTGEDNYTARVRGAICPPRDGFYTFWLASDDASELWLGGQREARVGAWTMPREWLKEPGQRSRVMALAADQPLYFELRFKQGGSADHFEVAWQGPDLPRQIVALK
ncbi:MAG TPA: glycoside hydrolase family 31 protein, partial [Thermoflexales bacterium]|nr:glycoside hydrolase family 31 protein [Thermoflexales bacterium]